jgi:CheY-like chemotaxis protein
MFDRFENPARSAAQSTLPHPGTILLVDNEPPIRRLLDLALTGQGFTVFCAASGREAVALYREHGPDIALVLLDVKMPGMDGVQTLQALQGINPDVLAVFMSGHTGGYTGEELLSFGALEVLVKPFSSLAELGQRLQQIIAMPVCV